MPRISLVKGKKDIRLSVSHSNQQILKSRYIKQSSKSRESACQHRHPSSFRDFGFGGRRPQEVVSSRKSLCLALFMDKLTAQ